MRRFTSGAVTKKEASALLSLGRRRSFDFDHSTVGRLVRDIEEMAGVALVLKAPSYWSVESRPQGHPPHYDGCTEGKDGGMIDNHMPWCRYSGSVLLTDPSLFEGGVLRFSNDGEEHKRDALCGLVAFSSGKDNQPQRHEVTPSRPVADGEQRVALLLFLAEEGGPL